MIASPLPSAPHPDNCPRCGHIHLGQANCYHSTGRDNLCTCKSTEGETMAKKKSRRPAARKPNAKHAARAQQAFIPGTQPETIPEIHSAIEDYVEARDRRMELTKVETEKKAVLLGAMKKHKKTEYAVDGHEAHLSVDETDKAKVRVPGEDGPAEVEVVSA